MEEEMLFPVLDRLVKTGFARGWANSRETGLLIDWDPEFEATGGEAAFRDFVRLLWLLRTSGGLSEHDQQVMILLRALLDASGGPKPE
jgi:hypothetical protein